MGHITTPGKFEGEGSYAPYIHALVLDGFAEEEDGPHAIVRLTPDTSADVYKVLGRNVGVEIDDDDCAELATSSSAVYTEREDGFVLVRCYASDAEADAAYAALVA